MVSEIANNDWKLAAEKLFNRLSSTHLNAISAIDNPIKRAFYEMETIRGCWTAKEGSSTTACECNKYSFDLRVLRVK